MPKEGHRTVFESETSQYQNLVSEIQKLHNAVDDLFKEVRSKKRDKWDVAAMVAQFASAVVLGLATFGVTYYAQVHLGSINAQTAGAQLDIARQNRTLDFLKAIAEAHSDPDKRTALIAMSTLAVPDQVSLVARYYAVSDEADSVRAAAIKILGQQQARNDLQYIIDSSRFPDADLARVQLGQAVKAIRVRVSQIDDLATVNVNGQELLRGTTAQDSGWQDIAGRFKPGKNEVVLKLANGPLGGYSIRFQLIAGGHSYDSGLIAKDACPCNAPVLEIHLNVELAGDMTVQRVSAAPPMYF
jgi:hypothetical protein